MSVQNIECQIAQAQIARLLVNEPLGQAIMADLEAHVAACPDCQAFIISKNRSLDVVVGDSEKPAKTKKTTKRKPEVEEAIQDNNEGITQKASKETETAPDNPTRDALA